MDILTIIIGASLLLFGVYLIVYGYLNITSRTCRWKLWSRIKCRGKLAVVFGYVRICTGSAVIIITIIMLR